MASKGLISCANASLAQASNKASSSPFLGGFAPSSVSVLSSSSKKLPSSSSSLVVKAQQPGSGGQPIVVSVPISTTTFPVHSPFNTVEDEHELKVRVDMPGVAVEDIDVKVEGGMLVVKDMGRQLYSPYDTKVPLPPNSLVQGIKAFLKNGVLHVTVPKYPVTPPVIHVPVRLG